MLINYLTELDLEHIKNHKYKTTGYSTLDNKMNPFWNYVADYIPYVISPNMVTLIGLFFLFSPIPIILYFDIRCIKVIPNWIYFYMAFSVFLGQTFDAIDGKHARKTNRCSSLGQFMDHGCDALSNSFLVVMISQAFRLGPGIYSIAIQIMVQFTFYIFNWEEFMTGVLCTNINDFGTTESQFISMALLIFPVFDFLDIAHVSLIFGLRLLDLFVIIAFITTSYMSILTIIKVVKQTYNDKDKFYNGLLMLISPMILFISEILFFRIKVYEEYTSLVILLNGMIFAFLTSKMILNSMSKCEPEIFSNDVITYFLVILICHYIPFYQQQLLLLFFFIFIVFRYIRFMLSIISQLLNYLHISF